MLHDGGWKTRLREGGALCKQEGGIKAANTSKQAFYTLHAVV
jgi:hypothetical protein